MKKFSHHLKKCMERKGINRLELAELLGLSPPRVSQYLSESEPSPNPANTDSHKKLDIIFNEPPGTFWKLAMEDIHGTDKLIQYATGPHKAGALNPGLNDTEKMKVISDLLSQLPEDRQQKLLSMCEALSHLPEENINTLEQLIRSLAHGAQHTKGKDDEE